MKYVLAIFTVFTSCGHSETTNYCGPNGKCSCKNKYEMDCSRTLLPLRDICEWIGNAGNISSLQVDLNAIETIGNRDLFGCEGLKKLYLRGNYISEIGETAFEGFHRLELLALSNNTLVQYYQLEGRLYFPTTLKTLMLNANINGSLDGNSSYPDIGSIWNLSMLYLDALPNVSFPDCYRNFRNLRSLSLSGSDGYCKVPVVSNATFENVPYLKVLNISNCSITNIHAGALKMLSMLERLDLSVNTQLGFRSLRNITYGLQFTNIKFINYSKVYTTFGLGTQITKRDVCYMWNTTLNEIAFSSNRLVMLETNSLMLLPKSLEIVHIEDNKFTFSPYILQLGCMANLTNFYGNGQNAAHNPSLFFNEPHDMIPKEDVSYDDCPFMKDDFLRNISLLNKQCPFFERNETIDSKTVLPQMPKSLRILQVSHCVLQYNVPALLILPLNNSFESLDFSDNVLSAWTGPVGPLPKLKHLDLSRNYCSYIGPLATKYLGTVENFQMQQNFIGLILANTDRTHGIFDGLVNVKILNLSSNAISYIPPSTLSKMTMLETLDLSVNNIDKWTIDVSNLLRLKHLNLRSNSIRNLPESVRTTLVNNLRKNNDSFKVDLRNNTIACTCEEKDFLKWMVKYKSSMVGFHEYMFCDAFGTRISVEDFVFKVNNLDKTCRSYVLLIVLSSIGISAFITIVIVGVIYKNRWKLRYLIRMVRIRHFGYRTLHGEAEHDIIYDHNAFVSFADGDREVVLNEMVPYLQGQDLDICHHEKNFQPGRNVHDNVISAIMNSRRTVAIISEGFVTSEWCMYEFNMARMESIYSRGGTSCLVVVMITAVPVRSMSNEMLAWIRANTYLEYPENEDDKPRFLQALCDAIQH